MEPMSGGRDTVSRGTRRGPAGIGQWFFRLGLSSALFLAMVAAFAVLVGLLAVSRSIAVPLILAVAIAMVLIPLVNWMEGRGVARAYGALLAVVLFVGVFVGALLVVGFALEDQSDELSAHLSEAKQEIETFLEDLPVDASIVGDISDGVGSATPVLRDGALTQVASALDTAVGVITGIVLGFIFLYYLLKDGAVLAGQSLGLFRPRDRMAASEIGAYAAQSTRDYFRSKTAMALINAVIITVGMLLLGVPEVAAIGVVNFIGGYIPYLGGFIGGAFAVLLGISEGGIGLGLLALAVVLFTQFVLENVLEPRIVGEFVDLHPLVVLIVTILGGTFGGFVGLILAVPIATIVIEGVRTLKRHGYFEDDPAPEPGH